MEIRTKGGVLLNGRLAELYSGNCPPERPCTREMIDGYRKGLDPITVSDRPVSAPVVPGSKKNALWKFAGQIYSYLEAKARWVAAGAPVTPPDELARRERACFACPLHDAIKDGCRVCGCGLDGGSLDEKRRMQTERCPNDPPYW